MFGNNVTSTWGQPQQNQQQQQGTSAFGQPAATSAFGTGNGKSLSINSFRAPFQHVTQRLGLVVALLANHNNHNNKLLLIPCSVA
jgi:hypothetical protein